MFSLCNGWEFTEEWFDVFAMGEGEGKAVRLPHNVQEMPLHYGDHQAYQKLCGYRRKLEIGNLFRGKKLFLQFDGAAHIATVYVNGRELATHRTGYTGFRVDITEAVNYGGDNLLAVKLDTTENGSIPPFGFVIDYLTYGGLYREVWLDVKEPSYIADVYVTTPNPTQLQLRVTAENGENCIYRIELIDAEEKTVLTQTCPATAGPVSLVYHRARAWSVEDPYRYTCRVTLLGENGVMLDTWQTKVGFRTAEFKADGFYLNGKKTFLRGLNRHQCYPYVGYAAPERLQREDARILKEELGCVIVRTSHYPQSHYFIDECDRLGLLVFTEIPAGSISATKTGRIRRWRTFGRWFCSTGIIPALSSGVSVSTKARMTMIFTSAPMHWPTNWIPAGLPPVSVLSSRATCMRMCIPTTIFPIWAPMPV